MLNGPRVSVIVAVYNGASTIRECIRSLLSMNFPKERLEVVVVDNASTDGTRAILHEFGNRIRCVSEAARGPAAARNAGVRAVSSDWIAFTDADCVVHPDWLTSLVAPLAEPDIGISGGRIASAEPWSRIGRFGDRIHDHRVAIEEREPPYAITMNWASRREVLVKAGLFDEHLLRGSDVDLSWRIQCLGYRLTYRNDAVIRHHNESTWRGLFHEGFMHGAGAARVRAKGISPAARSAGPFPTERRLMRGFRSLVTGRGMTRFDALCSVVFDAGKALGERSARRHPVDSGLT